MIIFNKEKMTKAAEEQVKVYAFNEAVLGVYLENLDQLETIWDQINKDIDAQGEEVEEDILIEHVVNLCLININRMYTVLEAESTDNNFSLESDELPNINEEE